MGAGVIHKSPVDIAGGGDELGQGAGVLAGSARACIGGGGRGMPVYEAAPVYQVSVSYTALPQARR